MGYIINAWLEIENTNRLEGWLADRIISNLYAVETAFNDLELGYADITGMSLNEATPIDEMLTQFNLIEEAIDKLHNLTFYPDTYYGGSFRWSGKTDMRKYLHSGVNRWINWLNVAKRYIEKDFETEYLTDINGESITDINDEQILVYKEW